MAIGVSTACLFPMELEKAVKKICENGVKTTEVFFNSLCEIKPPIIDEIKAITTEYGVRVKSCHPFSSILESHLLFSAYQRRFDDTRQLYKSYYEVANYLGADIVVLHGDRLTLKISDQEYFERYAKLYEDAKQYGITLVQENVVLYRSQSVEFIGKMKEYLNSECAFLLDIKQVKRANQDLYKMVDTMGDCLKHIHFSDSTDSETCLLPGDGNFNFNKLFNYNNAIKNCDKIIEVYENAYKNPDEIFKSYHNLIKSL